MAYYVPKFALFMYLHSYRLRLALLSSIDTYFWHQRMLVYRVWNFVLCIYVEGRKFTQINQNCLGAYSIFPFSWHPVLLAFRPLKLIRNFVQIVE